MQNILLTGAQGFLGKYIQKSLTSAGYNVDTLGRGTGNTVICDLSKSRPTLTQPYYAVVHAAGKAHMVPKTEEEKKDFFEVNLEGTRRLLQALEQQSQLPQTFVFISTIGVYGLSIGENIGETHSLAAIDPYGQSKIQAEVLVREWCTKNRVNYFSLRLPLISGANAPGNLGSMRKAIQKGYYFRIGKGSARKSIVLASDVADFIPSLFSKTQSGEYNLTDGIHPTFAQIEDKMAQSLGKKISIVIPTLIARTISVVGSFIPKFPLNSRQYSKITSPLTFSDQKARTVLGWNPNSFLEVPIT
ncbi:NAD-dependent epimerase/dehydratase family protein [Oscillatoria amoena NRMC-F 0135]|nr:NAD-dependent epimerase/dehydratase family protein [Oscillatoria amoena NRMC-F 0135]